MSTKGKICIIVGASHAGTNLAFNLRKEGWEGQIIIYDSDSTFPYHRPPLSKAYLIVDDENSGSFLFPKENYDSEKIELELGKRVDAIHKDTKQVVLDDGGLQKYDYLVVATGAEALIPPIKGIKEVKNVFTMRSANDALNIKRVFNESVKKRIVIIGGGFIGLETAASLKKIGAKVQILERESRVLARVTSRYMSDFFQGYHTKNGVELHVNKKVVAIKEEGDVIKIACDDKTTYIADLVVLGAGIRINTKLAESAGLVLDDGIKVDTSCKTSNDSIYAIGDCTKHYNNHYKTNLRLESVQNAVDQAKIAASTICGQKAIYDSIPWFWSDQFDLKLQMVGLSKGFDDVVVRVENTENVSFSAWYFKGEKLLSVDAVNNAKAYMLGGRYIKSRKKIDKTQLKDSSIPIKLNSFLYL